MEGAAVADWRDLFVQRLGMQDDELDPFRAEIIGIHGGYAYLGASLFRVWAGRTPGMTPTTIDEVYFGDHPDVPPYVAEDWHANARTSEVMAGWLAWATTDVTQDELQADREESLRICCGAARLQRALGRGTARVHLCFARSTGGCSPAHQPVDWRVIGPGILRRSALRSASRTGPCD